MPNDPRNPLLRAESLPELCSWRDVDFIRCAYVTILGRQPDQSGEFFYLGRLRSGISKLTIISQLRRSAEGRSHDPGIGGLDKALRRHRLARLPLLGACFRLLTGRAGDSYRERQIRVLSDLSAALQAGEELQKLSFEEIRRDVAALAVSLEAGTGKRMTALLHAVETHQNMSTAEIGRIREVLESGVFLASLEARIGERIRAVETQMGAAADAQQTVVAKSEDLGLELQSVSVRIDDVRSNVLALRGLLLKAIPRVFG